MSEEETLRVVGLDGYVVLRFLLLCARVGMVGGLVGLVVLLPVYSTSAGVEDVIGMNLHTMANVKAQSPRLWGPFFCMYLFSGAFLYLLHKEYEYFVTLRQQFFHKGDPDVPAQQLMSVIVENVPEEYRRSHLLKELFESLFPGEVAHAQIALKYAPLMSMIEERKQVLAKLEKAVALYEASDKLERPIVKLNKDGKPQSLPCGGEENDALDFFREELKRLNAVVSGLKKSAGTVTTSEIEPLPENTKGIIPLPKPEIKKVVGDISKVLLSGAQLTFGPDDIAATGFVTFTSRRAQAAACQLTMLSSEHPSLKAFAADAPGDIVWQNVSNSLASIQVKSLLTTGLLTYGIMFWASVLAFVAFVSQLSTLEKYLPFLKDLNPVIYSLLQGQLPVIALIVFISMLPSIFTAAMTKVDGRKSMLDIRSHVLDWFFFYQIANVYLLLLAGSVFGALTEVLDNPVSIVSIFARALPTVSTFFINLFITELLAGIPLMMLRIEPIVIYKLYMYIFNPRKLTRRDLTEGPLSEVDVSYELDIPNLLYMVAIQQTFMVISPILFILSGLFFSAMYLAWKYQLCYIVTPPSQMGGIFWYKIYKYSMTSLLTSSLTIIGYMGIKEGYTQSSLLIPLPFIITRVWTYTVNKFESISSDMAHNEAVAADTRQDELNSAKLAENFSPQFYLPEEISEGKEQEFSTPEVYRVSNIPLIDPSTGELHEVYHEPTFEEDMDRPSMQSEA